jgi:hypothetical protein
MLNIHKPYYFTCKTVADHTKAWALRWPIGPSALFFKKKYDILAAAFFGGRCGTVAQTPVGSALPCAFCQQAASLSAGPSALDCVPREKVI